MKYPWSTIAIMVWFGLYALAGFSQGKIVYPWWLMPLVAAFVTILLLFRV